MLAPDVAVFERLRAAARGHLRVITVAPELPGATRVIETATRAGDRAMTGERYLSRRESRRSLSSLPSVWHVGQ